MTKKRKSLDDSLASEFVFGEEQPQTEAAPKPKDDGITAVEDESTRTSRNFEVSSKPVSSSNAPIEEKPVEKSNKESSLMKKLQVEAKEGTKRFTIDLRESVHRKLSILAAKTGRSKADIVRMLLDEALEDVNE